MLELLKAGGGLVFEGLLQRKARVVEGGVVILQKLHPSHACGCHFHKRTVVNCQAVAGDERPHQMQPAQKRWSCGEKMTQM